jgi:putative protease
MPTTTVNSIRIRQQHLRKLARPELLAPAGSLEKLKFAVHYGADAVYIGGQKYGLRSNADNFSFDEMDEGVRFARKYGAKVFVTTNIYAHEEDLDGIGEYLKTLREIGIDAIISADPAVFHVAQREVPELEVHLSTQQSVLNWKAVQFWKEQGIPRIVLAREVSLDDIILIKRKVDVEIEAFIHGAMCSSYSGRCVLSNHFTDRDSNRGGCSQSCRWKYDLYAPGDGVPDDMLASDVPVFDEDDDPFTMGSRDLAMIGHMPELIEAGIDSFKIEGRMRSIHYVASVVYAYRQAIDAYMESPDTYTLNPEWVEEIHKAANRPLNTGFFLGEPGAGNLIYGPEEKAAPFDFAGQVLGYDPSEGVAVVQQRSYFRVGQEIEFFGPQGVRFRQVISDMRNESGEQVSAARHPLEKLYVKVNGPVQPMDMLRKRSGRANG